MSLLSAFVLSLATQAQPAPPAAAPAPERDPAVIAAQLGSWKGGLGKAEGRLVCRTHESTGDRQLDAIRCGAMLTCTRPIADEIDRLMSTSMPRGEKRLEFDGLLATVKPCIADYQERAVARLAAERAAS